MESLPMLILYLIILIISAILFDEAIKKDTKERWNTLFIIQTLSVLMSFVFLMYFNMTEIAISSSTNYLNKTVFSFIAVILYSLLFFIAVCTRIIKFEKNMRKSKRKSYSPIILISAIALICISILSFGFDILENKNIKSIEGRVTSVKSNENGYVDKNGKKELYPTIEFNIDGISHQDYVFSDYFKNSVCVGDKVKVFYDTESFSIVKKTNNHIISITCLVAGILLLVFRFKKILFKKKK